MLHRKNIIHLSILLFCLLILAVEANAQILDNINDTYKTASSHWLEKMMPIATSLFWKLAAIEFAWSAIVWVVQQENLQSFTAVVIKKIMGIGFFYALLFHADTWMPAIINSFVDAGKAAGAGGLSPSQVIDTGVHFANVVLLAIEKKSIWTDTMTVIFGGLSSLGMVIAFTIIAGQLLIALIESYIVVSAGVLFLGFGGSRWTTEFTQKYLSYAVATGVKLFMLYLIVSLGMAQAEAWKSMLETAKYSDMLSVLGASLILCFLAFQIPNMAASMLSGAPSLTAGTAMGTAGAVAAGTVAAGGAAMSPALQSARGGMQALKAGYDHHRASGSGMLASALKAVGTSTVDYGREAMRSGGEVMGLATPTESRSVTIGGRAAETRRAATDTLRAEQAASGSAASGQVPPPRTTTNNAPAAEATATGLNQQSGQGQAVTRQASDSMQDVSPAKMGSAAPQTTAGNVSASNIAATGSSAPTGNKPVGSAIDAATAGMAGAAATTGLNQQSGQGQAVTRQASDSMQDVSPAKMGSAAPQTTAGNVSASNIAATGSSASSSTPNQSPAKNTRTTEAGDATWNSDAAEASAAGTRPKTTVSPPKTTQRTLNTPSTTAAQPAATQAETIQKEKPILGDIQQVRAPEIPNDAAPQAGINIQIHHSDD